MKRAVLQYRFTALLVWFIGSLIAAEPAPPEKALGSARIPVLLKSLESDDFKEREQAAKELATAEYDAIPSLSEKATGIAKDDNDHAELKQGLNRVLREIRSRHCLELAKKGSPVDVDLHNATLENVLTTLARQTGIEVNSERQPKLEMEELKRDFRFKGNYWNAVALADRTFAIEVPRNFFTEDMTFKRSIVAVTWSDILGMRGHCQTQGMCLTRLGRISLEKNPGGSFTSVVVVPVFEPNPFLVRAEVGEISCVIPNGKTIASEQKSNRGWDFNSIASLEPESNLKWCFTLNQDMLEARSIELKGTILAWVLKPSDGFFPYEEKKVNVKVLENTVIEKIEPTRNNKGIILSVRIGGNKWKDCAQTMTKLVTAIKDSKLVTLILEGGMIYPPNEPELVDFRPAGPLVDGKADLIGTIDISFPATFDGTRIDQVRIISQDKSEKLEFPFHLKDIELPFAIKKEKE